MGKPEVASSCSIHLERHAVATCDVCGRTLCSECRVRDFANERDCCSTCRFIEPPGGGARPAHDGSGLAAGFDRPFRMGWSLWLRSIPVLAVFTFPVAVLIAGVLWWGGLELVETPDAEPEVLGAAWAIWGAFAAVVYGFALVGVLLTQAYTGHVPQHPYVKVFLCLLPWAVTWILVSVVVLLGSLALIVPGVILGIRLFWADEFALIHGLNPFAAMRESWTLTRGYSGRILVLQLLAGLASYPVLIVFVLLVVAGGWTLGSLQILLEGTLRDQLQFGFASWAGLVLYGALHAPEIVFFYGLRALRQ